MDKSIIQDLEKILYSLSKNYMDDEKCNRLENIIKTTLNSKLNNLVCCNVFIVKGNDEYIAPVSVVPEFSWYKISNTESAPSTQMIYRYNIEINVSQMKQIYNVGYSNDEYIAWFFHELCENVISDKTLTRIKADMIRYYNYVSNRGYKDPSSIVDTAMCRFGSLIWLGHFGRTSKSFIDEKSSDFTSIFLTSLGLENAWNSALNVYINLYGGDPTVITDEWIANKDKGDYITFNKLVRRYASSSLKYNDTDYKTLYKYVLNYLNSKLVESYLAHPPYNDVIISEIESHHIFNDNKITLQSGHGISEGSNTNNYFKEYTELKLDVDNVITESEKLSVMLKLKNFSNKLNDALSNDVLNHQALQPLREKVFTLVNDLNNKKCTYNIMDNL